MSSKSSAQPESHGHTLFSRKFILIAAIAIIAIFFLTITYYPLIFSSETHTKATVDTPK
jgi:hypothetical protein